VEDHIQHILTIFATVRSDARMPSGGAATARGTILHPVNIDFPLMTLSESRITQLLDNFHGRRIAVIGDVMLDRYYRGTVSRISPEAPVPIVDIEDESEYPGGAANVAYNLVMLGASPLLLGIIGNDVSGAQLRELLGGLGISDQALLNDP